MTTKKFQIFVSSTFTDLAETRSAVMDSIQRMNQFPVGMEQFSADDDEQWQIIQETIQQTDYYICIIGHRYGTVGKDGLSYTEREWNYAKELAIPIMTFVRERNAATTPQERELDSKLMEKLDAFIHKAKGDKMVDFWSDTKDLETKVVTALFKAFSRKPRPGWIRPESERVAEQMAALIEENRSLKNKIDRLLAQATNSRPAFKLLFNGRPDLSVITLDKKELRLTNLPPVKPILWDSVAIELKEFLTKQEVDEYNAKLPPTAEIERVLGQIHSLESAQQTASQLVIEVENIGSAKAREVIVDLVFPEWVRILDKDEFEELEVPELDLPPNPLIEAERRMKESKVTRSLGSILGSLRVLDRGLSMEETDLIRAPSISLRNIVSAYHSCHVKDNKVSIWMKDLMHTRRQEFANLILIPLKANAGHIEVSAICEELPAPHEEKIRIEIAERPSQ